MHRIDYPGLSFEWVAHAFDLRRPHGAVYTGYAAGFPMPRPLWTIDIII
jgi:hypothetical protein